MKHRNGGGRPDWPGLLSVGNDILPYFMPYFMPYFAGINGNANGNPVAYPFGLGQSAAPSVAFGLH